MGPLLLLLQTVTSRLLLEAVVSAGVMHGSPVGDFSASRTLLIAVSRTRAAWQSAFLREYQELEFRNLFSYQDRAARRAVRRSRCRFRSGPCGPCSSELRPGNLQTPLARSGARPAGEMGLWGLVLQV